MLALAMYISFFLCRFHLRLVPNSNPISGGIWALQYILLNATNMENIVEKSKNTISLVLIVILTVSFD